MSKQVRIRVNYGKTINLGNYESERIDMSIEMDVDVEGWMAEEVYLLDQLRALVKTQIHGE